MPLVGHVIPRIQSISTLKSSQSIKGHNDRHELMQCMPWMWVWIINEWEGEPYDLNILGMCGGPDGFDFFGSVGNDTASCQTTLLHRGSTDKLTNQSVHNKKLAQCILLETDWLVSLPYSYYQLFLQKYFCNCSRLYSLFSVYILYFCVTIRCTLAFSK